ncbi:MAG TPA: NADH-quinone oxidoreductase subunit L [Gaiellales bacterium]|jgi:NADH-quinone oxidoreductase subunit L|nr:NADH-quinone oxidoreductase subunit L [Gaiellales bacterium]
MNAADYGWLVLLTPLIGLGFNMAVGPSVSRRVVAWGASLSILGGFVFSLLAFIDLLTRDDSQRAIVSTGWHWLSAGSFRVDASILVDPLSSVMLLVITGIGFLIHAYSVGYMDGDPEEKRFFAYLNLFIFSMLLLVLAGNFVFLLAGWGLVGLSSYLLIGFWWQRPTAVAAAKKAFIMNAIGDVGMTLGIFVIWNHLHTVDYATAFALAPGSIGSGSSTANWIALLLLVGAVAKSAQIPLQTWLPDAMEGPTPVSALIHAATMVTAGVYLVARMWPFYSLAPDVSDLVAIVGVATLTIAGLIALVQTDIKRVIAYSTMSQIGYMFCGVGMGAYSSGIFHLVMHAFFKALLFLGAGVVIHALHDEQDMRKMGGMSRYLPYTTGLMWIGALALAGVPPFSGFFSKDQILADALTRGDWVGYTVWGLGLAGAFVTALYTFRLMLLVFHGEPSEYAREQGEAHAGQREGPFSMLWPIGVLAVGTIIAGVIEIPQVTHGMRNFLDPTIPSRLEATGNQDLGTSALAVGLALVGLYAAHVLWGKRSDTPRRIAASTAPLERVLQEKFGFDLLYDWAFYRPAAALASAGARVWEGRVVVGGMDVVSGANSWTSRLLSSAQSGLVRVYALAIAIGIAALAAWFITGAS